MKLLIVFLFAACKVSVPHMPRQILLMCLKIPFRASLPASDHDKHYFQHGLLHFINALPNQPMYTMLVMNTSLQ